jgi:RNA polymerase sigma-70 factor (ECF subfamily)
MRTRQFVPSGAIDGPRSGVAPKLHHSYNRDTPRRSPDSPQLFNVSVTPSLSTVVDSSSADHRLVREVLLGNDASVDALIDRLRCVPLILSHRNFRMGSPLSRDDLTDLNQDTLTLVWQKLEEFEGRSSLETWIYSFCSHQMLNAIRSKRRRPQTTDDDALDQSVVHADEAIDGKLLYEHVYAGLARLDGPQAEVIQLHHFSALTFEQIAAQLKLSTSTAKSHYYRGVERLRGLLGPHWRGGVA